MMLIAVNKRERLAWMAVATLENMTLIFSSREFHENFFNGIEYKILRRFPVSFSETNVFSH